MPINMPLFASISMNDNMFCKAPLRHTPPTFAVFRACIWCATRSLIKFVRQVIFLFNSQFISGITQSFCHTQVHLFILLSATGLT